MQVASARATAARYAGRVLNLLVHDAFGSQFYNVAGVIC